MRSKPNEAVVLHNRPPFFLNNHGWTGRLAGFALGGLCVLGQAPLHFWPLALLGFACLFLRLQWAGTSETPRRAGFSSAFWFALGYFGLGVFWVGTAFIERGPEFIPVMPFMVFALAAILALFWAIAGYVFAGLRLKPVWAQFGFVALFTLAELARGYAFSGFPWNLTGYIFPAGGALSQGAALWTIYGQSCFVFLLSALIATALFMQAKRFAIPLFIIALGGLFAFGHMRLSAAEIQTHDDIKLRIVSVPFEQADKFDVRKSTDIVNSFLTESLSEGVQNVSHIIWPEGAATGLAMENEDLLYAMGRELAFANNYQDLPVWLLNSLRLEQRPDPKSGRVIDDYYNSSVAVTFDGNGIPAIAAYNDKARLVPFGEFIPFGKWMESKNVPVISTNLLSISAASQKTLTQFPGLPIGSSQLCYEIIFPGFTPKPNARTKPKAGTESRAEFILNQSNDAWFGGSWGPAQHANIARYRAIEEGLPVIRAASNGVSGVFDPYGRILAVADKKKISHIDVKLPKPLTYNTNSTLLILAVFLINLLIALLCIVFGRDRQVSAIH